MDYHLLLMIAGRLLMGGIFIFAGIMHFLDFQPPLAIIRGRGVPNAAAVLVIGSVWEIVLGLMVVLGIGLLPASLGLVLFLIPATIIFHNFWDHQGLARVQHLHVVMTNVMVAGGLLILAASTT